MGKTGLVPSDHRAASAVVVVRPGPDVTPELMFVKRPQAMRFLGGFHAFAGGALHDEDSSPAILARAGISEEEARHALGDAAGGEHPVAFFICAMRELFEETGLLYVKDHPAVGDLSEIRSQLGASTFAEILERYGLELDASRLRFHQRWVAPEVLPVRFDLRVFVAPLAEAAGQVEPDPSEVERVDWLSAAQARALAEVGSVLMAPPTSATADSLGRYATVDDLMSDRPSDAGSSPLHQHSPTVRRLVAPNASLMTGPGTNSYVVGTGPFVVIDPGSMEPDHLHALAELGDIETIVITHGHSDHLAGALDLAQMTGAEMAASPTFWERTPLSKKGRRLADGDTVQAGEVALQVITTPGHSSDHVCLWDASERALFCGDLLMGEGTAVISPPDGNLADYLESLKKVSALKPGILYPGHFPPRQDAMGWIEWYQEHRAERERQILEALEDGASTPEEIVERIYLDVPKALHPIAVRQVMAHLEKLGRA